MFSAFNLNNPPCGRLSNHNQTTPLDDRTQKQILKLKKEMGALSKDKAVLEQQVEMLKFQLDEETTNYREKLDNQDRVLLTLKSEKEKVDEDKVTLEGILQFKAQEATQLTQLVGQLRES